jgi:hypothetical protein
MTGTNVFITNFVAGVATGFTNSSVTMTSVEQLIADDEYGIINYYQQFFGDLAGLTNANGIFSSTDQFVGITNFPEGPCLNVEGQLFFQTNVVGTVTNVLAIRTNTFCVTTTSEDLVPSAVDGEDYLSTDSTNLVFDDYQMSQDVYLNLPGGFIFGGASPGPQFPSVYGRTLSRRRYRRLWEPPPLIF